MVQKRVHTLYKVNHKYWGKNFIVSGERKHTLFDLYEFCEIKIGDNS